MKAVMIQTPRLSIREFSPDDAGFIFRLVNTPDWLHFIGDKNVYNEGDALTYLSNGPFASYRKHGFGMWNVSLLDGTPIGMCGILQREGLTHPDLGFAFLPEYRGKGYALEAAEAVLECAFSHFGLSAILAITMHTNHSAQRLLTKLGMTYDRDVLLAGPGNQNLMLFSIANTDQ